MKRLLTLVSILFIAIALVGCGAKTDKEKVADSYSTLKSADHVFELIDYKDMEDAVANDEKAIVYLGAPI
jgi:hypothetical protein